MLASARSFLTCALCLLPFALVTVACSDPERERVKATTQASYDTATGKLAEITYDKNKNGKIDTWTKMNGGTAVASRIDTNEDGVIDRWEDYDAAGKLIKVSWTRAKPPAGTGAAPTEAGKPDAFAFIGADGVPERIEYTEVSDVTKKEGVVRREIYQGTKLLRAEEDSDGDNLMDRFENFVDGNLVSVEYDEGSNGTNDKKYDGVPDRRINYANGGIASIETQPDGKGGYLKKTIPGAKK
jgi:hypothetical protein